MTSPAPVFFYITLGTRPDLHAQCAFSLLSLQAQGIAASQITVLTDEPAAYAFAHGIEVELLHADRVKAWRGAHDFFWRVKIEAIRYMCQKHAGQPVVYLDTDNFAARPLAPMLQGLAAGKAYMDKRDFPITIRRFKTVRRMWQTMQGNTYAGYAMEPSLWMWIAGTVALPNAPGDGAVDRALALCDALLDDSVTPQFVEQWALAVVLQKDFVLEASEPWIVHYWSVKPIWNAWIDAYFSRALREEWTPAQIVANTVQAMDAGLPRYKFERTTAKRLHRVVDRWWPAKDRRMLE